MEGDKNSRHGVLGLGELDVMPHFSMKVGNQDGDRRWQKGKKNDPLVSRDKILLNVYNPKILGCPHKSLTDTLS